MAKKKDDIIEAHYSKLEVGITQFDHDEWAAAQPIQIARHWSGKEAPPSRHAEARIIWSTQSLEVRFNCRQMEPMIVSSNPQRTQKTIGLWDRDVCEIFIAPDPNWPERYFEFEAAPTGEWVDLEICLGPTERETDEAFFSGMTTASQIVGQQLTTIIRIPWGTQIGKPNWGDEWRVNLFRCVGTGDERYLAWRPTYTPEPNFHVPQAFGLLRFV